MKPRGSHDGLGWVVGVVGVLISILLLAVFPTRPVASAGRVLPYFERLVGILVFVFSLRLLLPESVIRRMRQRIRSLGLFRREDRIDYGWSTAWMNVFWVAGAALLAFSAGIYCEYPNRRGLAFVLFLLSLNAFAANVAWRWAKKHLTLPWVDLFSSDRDRVLDVGCGSGRTTLAISKVLKNGSITALDRFDSSCFEEEATVALERNLKIAGISDRVRIVKGDVTNLEFPEGSFDSAVSTYAMDHLDGKSALAGMKEVHRVLKPGGRFLLIVMVPGYVTFAMDNVLCLFLVSRRGWRAKASQAGFRLADEGEIDGTAYFVFEKQKQVET